MGSVMWLVFLHGPPAVGKLTVAAELVSMTSFRLFYNHLTVDLVASVFEFGNPGFVDLREEIWLSVFQKAAAEGVSLVFTFAPERTVRRGFPQAAVEAVEAYGGRVVFVELTCPEIERERRLENASRAKFGKLRLKERYRELRDSGAFEYQSMPNSAVSIDTSSCTPKEAAARIAQWIATASRTP
jgi:hypothetical protein